VKKKKMKRRNKKAIEILFAAMLLSTLLLFNTAIATQPIELTYDFAEPVMGKTVIGEQEYDTVSIPGCDMYGAPGEPVLPFKTARILIPYGEEVQDIQVIPGEEIYRGEFYVEPGQKPVSFSFTGPVAATQPDGVIYNSYKPFPEEIYSEVSVQGMKGYQILILNLYPVKYVPKVRKLSYFDSMQVVVSTTASTPSELFRGVPEDRAETAKIVDNPDALSTYDYAKASKPERSPLSPPTDQYDYVIITNEALLGTGGPYNFQALRDSKIANGMSATIVTTEWIYANYGSTSALTSPPKQREMSEENVPAFAAGTEVLAASASISEVSASLSKVPENVSTLPATYEIPPVAVTEYELKYDDGSAEEGFSVTDIGVGCIFAVCFTPPEYPVTVKKARLFIYNYGTPSTPITIHVYEQASGSSAPGAELITPFTVTPPGPGWYDIDLSGYNIVINSGSFAIGEGPTQGYSVYLGEDQTGPIDYRSWFYNLPTQTWYNWATQMNPGDLMIRAIVESGGGVDDQTKIRNFIKDAYTNWGTKYVLLGGDGDGANVGGESGDNIIPARGFWTGLTGDECSPPNIPADMYYSCLDGTFDHNGNGIYGEPVDGPSGGEVDLFAEVYVGRAPVDSSTEVSNFVMKTLAYDSAPFLPKALMVGEDLGWIPWGSDYKDEVKDGANTHGYTTVGFPQPPFVVDTLYDRDYPGFNWPKSVLITKLNNNPNIVNHLGHANPTYVMKLSNSDVDSLTNSKYFFGWTQGCYDGSFDNRWFDPGCNYGPADCILEHFVVDDHGAFAFIGNSRYGWGSTVNTNGPTQRFDREFWDAVFGEGITRIGVANADSKEDNAGLIGDLYIRFCYYEINLFGDPAIELATGAGVTTTLYYPDFTDTNDPNSWRSWLVIQNPSASTANIGIELRSRTLRGSRHYLIRPADHGHLPDQQEQQ
jgi:hypothetical protein